MINVETLLAKMYDEDAGNHFDDLSLGKMFDSPLVCVADAHDPWFDRFKEIIGDFAGLRRRLWILWHLEIKPRA